MNGLNQLSEFIQIFLVDGKISSRDRLNIMNKARELGVSDEKCNEILNSIQYSIITMPKISDTMNEGVLKKWLKKVGDSISEGDCLAEIETDKATLELESFYEGTLLYLAVKEEETVDVGELLVIIGKQDTNIEEIINNFKVAPLKKEAEILSTEISLVEKTVKLTTYFRSKLTTSFGAN
ncbi:MAG: hypothetical protein APF83_01475 [Lutibacter sp. BRH_c52]|nr:MAG: hypothetical protein APF83_01475 [Lutibacter sp. BRH_c52]